MDLGRSEAWARPFKCAICGRRAADKFTIEHHVQFEHGARDRFISASMTAHQLRLPGATQAGSQSYGPPFRGPEDGIQPRMYASPSSVLNPPRYVQQALRSASGELLGWKTVIDPGFSERYASSRPLGLRSSIRRGSSTITTAGKQHLWTEPFCAQQTTSAGTLDHLSMAGSSVEIDQRHYQTELASVERGQSYMTSGASASGQIYPHGIVGPAADLQRSLQIARPSLDAQRQSHPMPAPLLSGSRYVQIPGAGSPAEDHLQGQLAGLSGYSPYHAQLSQISVTSGSINGVLDAKASSRPAENSSCQSQATRGTSESVQRHLQVAASQVDPSQRNSWLYTASASAFNQRVHPYTPGHPVDSAPMSSEPSTRLPMSLSDNPLTPGAQPIVTQLYPSNKSGQLDEQTDGSCSSSQSKHRNTTSAQASYLDSRRGYLPSGSYSSSQYYHSTEALPEQFRPQPDSLLASSEGDRAKQSSSSFTELGSYATGPRPIASQDHFPDNQGNASTAPSGQPQVSLYEGNKHLEQISHPLPGSSGQKKRDSHIVDQCIDNSRHEFANSVSFQPNYTAHGTGTGHEAHTQQGPATTGDQARYHDTGVFTNTERGGLYPDEQLQMSVNNKIETVSEKREISEEFESGVFKRRETMNHREANRGEDKENQEDTPSESQEGESDETVQSMVNSNRCRRCGCAVRGQCDNPSSLIEPDKIIIITNSSSASTSQMTITDGDGVQDDASESAPEVVLPDACYDQPTGGENQTECADDHSTIGRTDSEDFSRLVKKNEEDPPLVNGVADEARLLPTIDDPEHIEPDQEAPMPIQPNLQTQSEAKDCDLA